MSATHIAVSQSDVVDLAHQENESSQGEWTRGIIDVTVSVKNFSFSVKSRRFTEKILPCFFAPRFATIGPTAESVVNNRVFLLRDVSMIARPGELTAVMGPSGCGKTTLLNAIADRAKGQVEGGSVYFNNVPGSKKNLHRVLSMVYAQDMILPNLTVFETLMFAAVLRMGGVTQQERKEAVEHVMKELALTRVRDTRVGGFWHKGLSTGELRRLSIAQELIGNPAVLLLDEPTSGLDAVLAYEIMYVLRMVAKAGRTVICSLHQPRTAIFELLDNLVLMGRGRTLYCGPPKTAVEYFEKELNLSTNGAPSPAEFLIEVASEVVPYKESEPFSDGDVGEDRSSKKNIGAKLGLEEDPELMNHDSSGPPLCVRMGEQFINSNTADQLHSEIDEARAVDGKPTLRFKVRSSWIQWWLELYAVMYRSFRNTWRNPLSFGTITLVQLLVGIFLGSFFFDMPSKYLPDERPVDIGDENSPAMRMFDTPLLRFFTTGIDGNGTNPLFELLIDGVDGQGSMPFDDFQQWFLASKWAELPECAYAALNLEKYHKYMSTDFSEYRDIWALEEGENGVPEYVSAIMQGLQTVDYILGDTHWQQIYDHAHRYSQEGTSTFSATPFFAWPECVGETNEIMQAMAVCSGVYPEVPGAQDGKTTIIIDAGLLYNACPIFKTRWMDNYVHPEGEDESTQIPYIPAAGKSTTRELWRVDLPAKEPPLRKLQTGAIISSVGASFWDFLPETAVQAIDKIGEYREATRECPHPFCQELSQTVDEADSSIGDYGAVLGAVMNLGGALFFAVANTGFATYDALITFHQERSLYNREVANQMYKIEPYFIGKTLAALPFQMVPVILQNTAFFFLVNLDAGENGETFFKFLAIILLFSFTCYGYSYLISTLSPTMEIAVVAAPLILVILICCSGFFVRDSGIPYWMGWVKIISIFRWGFFALLNNQFPSGESFWGLPNDFSLALMGIAETRIGICVMWIAILGVSSRFLAMLAVRFGYRHVGLGQ